MRFAAAVAAVALGLGAGQAPAAQTASDPILGYWKVTRGGSGTIRVAKAGKIYAVFARNDVRLGCLSMSRRDLVGFVELPSRTRLPKGVYSANFGPEGHGCNYAVRLRLSGNALVGKVLYSENEQPGGPFTLRRTG